MTVAEQLEVVRHIEIRTNRLVDDILVGAYLSRFKGRGTDFEELRAYVPGDDIRDIDWNVTYRMGQPFVKRFREERELPLVLALDISGSSTFGSGKVSKRRFASEVGATLAASAAHNGDKVGLLLFTDRMELYIPPRKGRRHILRIIHEMLFFQPQHRRTDIQRVLAELNHVLRRRALVFLLTDFLHSFEAEAGRQRDAFREIGITNTHHDLVCMHLHDPCESHLPAVGLLTVRDTETGEVREVDSSRPQVRRSYAEHNAARLTALDQALQRAGVDTLRFSTTKPFVASLQHFFETRRGRRHG